MAYETERGKAMTAHYCGPKWK